MKSLEELRALFVGARRIAKEASPERATEAAELLDGFSQHCKELYNVSDTYLERAKCRNLYESIDNVITILRTSGFCNEIVASFFGFCANGISFSDISAGRASIKKADVPAASAAAAAPKSAPKAQTPPAAKMPALPDDEPAPVKEVKRAVPPAPAAAAARTAPAGPAPAAPAVPVDAACINAKPAEDRLLDPESFDGFIGQERVVRRLKKEITAARKQGKRHLDNILLLGNRGLGKSTLIEIIANELGVRLEKIDGTSLTNDVRSHRLFHSFFVRIATSGEPCVIAIDEIHALPVKLQSCLLSLLQSRSYTFIAENGEAKSLAMPEFTFLAATTNYENVLATVKDRCSNLTFMLQDYTREELRRIFYTKLSALGLTVADEGMIDSFINRCRSSIRTVTSICKGIHTIAINRDVDTVTSEMADEYFSEWGVDALGLNSTERRILEILRDEPSGSVSGETLSARLYLDPGILSHEYEPYLLKIGFISINSRGRCLTQKGYDYLQYGYYVFDDGYVLGSKPAPDAPAAPAAAEPAAPVAPVVPAPAAPAAAEPEAPVVLEVPAFPMSTDASSEDAGFVPLATPPAPCAETERTE